MSLVWTEYLVVAVSLALSIWVGVRSKITNKKESCDDVIKNQVPLGSIIVSLIAAETSGVSMLGKPAEAYAYGMEFFYVYAIAALGCLVLCIYGFVPILTELKTPTLYDYFELRFDARVRRLTTVTFIILKIFYTGTSLIPPAIVITQFSGVDIDYIIIGLSSITIFYTTLGGLKGVVYTDLVQGIIMLVSMGILTAISVFHVGGIGRIMTVAYETGRTQLPSVSTFDLSARSSVWVYLSFLYSLSPVFLNHSNYQRIRLLNTEKMKLTLSLLICGMVFMAMCATFTGLAIYAFYYGCDPKTNKLIPSYSNLVVYWLNDVGNKIVGLRGVYIAGITCASISSMSTHMNSSSDLMYNEIARIWKNINRTVCMRCLTIIVGIIGSLFALYFKRSGSLVELNYCLIGIEGIISSLFIMGAIFVPANATGALTGGVCSLVFTLFIALGSRIFLAGYKLQYSTKYMSIDSCPNNASVVGSTIMTVVKPVETPFFLFTVSPFCVGILAVLISLAVGLTVSVIFPDNNFATTTSLGRYDPNLYAPLVQDCVTRVNRERNKKSVLNEQDQGHSEESLSLRMENKLNNY